jgi:hypothetical protein
MEGRSLARRVAAGATVLALAAGCRGGDTTIINYGPTQGPSSAAGQQSPEASRMAIPAASASELSGLCQAAEQLGPWPPETNGQFHDIEVDGTQAGSYVEAEMWFPGSNGEWWINVSGRRVQFNRSAGTGFQWNGNCDPSVVRSELDQAAARRRSEGVNVHTDLSLDEFMARFPGRVTLLTGDGQTR